MTLPPHSSCFRFLATGIVILMNLLTWAAAWAQSWTWPIGGQRGTTVNVQAIGFGGGSQVIFDCDQLQAETHIAGDATTRLEIKVGAEAALGYHTLRVVSPGSVTRKIVFLVHAEPTVMEAEDPHDEATKAQPIQVPAAVHGRLEPAGEADYYVFEVKAGDELTFELNTASGLIDLSPPYFTDPEITVYDPTGSWFDDQNPREIICTDESEIIYYPLDRQVPTSNDLPRLTYRFENAGWRVIRVGSKSDKGGPSIIYTLRIAPAIRSGPWNKISWTPRRVLHPDPEQWRERDFDRKLEPDWIQKILSRAVLMTKEEQEKQKIPEGFVINPEDPKVKTLPVIQEQEPNDSREQAQSLEFITIREGSIDKPGDVDNYRFSAKAGQPLAFELRSTEVAIPYFNPKLAVFDAEGNEVFDNIYRFIGGDGDDWGKSAEPKILHTFENAGEYTLEIRDLTSRNGRPDFLYQVLVRPQIPHMGNVAVKRFASGGSEFLVDSVVLGPNAIKKLTVVLEKEEGFSGDVALKFKDLPESIEALALATKREFVATQAGQVFEERMTLELERYRPEREIDTILMRADSKTTPTETVEFMQIVATPFVNNRMGTAVPVHRIPVNVN
jgi:hypothetical protein